MKKTKVLNSEMSSVISKMGHTQTLTIGDAGLPIYNGVQRIDLALTHNIPTFMQTLEIVLEELCVERVILAEEIKTINPILDAELQKKFADISYVPHSEFKELTKSSEAVIRTGETKAYANIILCAGVVF
ncbi:D-ribose pyranase [Chakrabartyella piscis]|uniref:D-ribose pyranase n=1 Tax=Chakrabartyella piscis TaxID=2918914 RepID=UPI0029586AF7|nr:D-ribose pyranase [Chakrabartyella piscis]